MVSRKQDHGAFRPTSLSSKEVFGQNSATKYKYLWNFYEIFGQTRTKDGKYDFLAKYLFLITKYKLLYETRGNAENIFILGQIFGKKSWESGIVSGVRLDLLLVIIV